MGANRNTINEDITFWHSVIKKETRQENDDHITRQISIMDAQHSRTIKLIADDEAKNSIKYEKMLLNIEERVNRILPKIKGPENTDRVQQTEEGKKRRWSCF